MYKSFMVVSQLSRFMIRLTHVQAVDLRPFSIASYDKSHDETLQLFGNLCDLDCLLFLIDKMLPR